MRIYDVKEVARFFLAQTNPDENHSIDNLKLQKLCYYAQGIICAVRGKQLFDSPLVAWEHGPVVQEVYDTYKQYGSNPIPKPNFFDVGYFEPSVVEILNEVYKSFGQYSGWKLRKMTHIEPPWQEAISSSNKIIRLDTLKEFFTEVLEHPEKELIEPIHILNVKSRQQMLFEGYQVVNPVEISEFVTKYNFLGEIVQEAKHEIKNVFLDSNLYLELIADNEYPKDIKLVISISPHSPPNEAFEKFKEVRKAWWHTASKKGHNKLALTLGYK